MQCASYILNAKVGCFRSSLHGINTLKFVRFESNAARSLYNCKTYRSLSLVQEHVAKGGVHSINCEVINSVLLNQKVAISPKELDELLRLPSVKFDLPITDETQPSLQALIVKPHSKRSNTGVYVFTHKPTGNKYVGSSNDLEDLLFANKNYGLLIPLICK